MTLDKADKEKDGATTPAGQQLQPGSGQTSSLEQLTSKIEDGKQYGGADVRKLVEDALSADGRIQKDRADKSEAELNRLSEAHSGLTTLFQTVSQQVADLLKAKDDAEAETVKDDPVALGSLRARQANWAEALRLQSFEASVKAREAKAAEEKIEVNKRLTSVAIKMAAMESGVDEAQLADLVPDGNPERLKKIANILKQSGITKPGEKTKPAGLMQKPASVISAGGAETGIRQIIEKARERQRGK